MKALALVVSTVVLAAPHNSSGAQWTPSIVGDEVKGMGPQVAALEVINHAGFEADSVWGRLIGEPEIYRRLEFVADRTLQVARRAGRERQGA